MNLLSQLLSANATPAPQPKRKHKRETEHIKVTSRYNHLDMVERVRALTGKSFTSADLLGITYGMSGASRICRTLLECGYVTMEKGAVRSLGTKRLNRYTWKDNA